MSAPSRNDFLAEANLALVGTIVTRYAQGLSEADREEAVSIGYLALLTAARRFDPARGFAFSTFAWRVVSREIIDFKQLLQRNREREGISLDALLAPGEGSDGMTLADRLPDPASGPEGVAGEVLRDLSAADLWQRVAQLPPHWASVIEARYRDDRTLTEVAATEGKKREDLSGYHARALRHLRANWDA